MFRNLSSSAAHPQSRRQQHPHRNHGVHCGFNWEAADPDVHGWSGGLDLSIHHPTSHSTPPSPTIARDREYHASLPRRRTRNSRGTKEAKKRRDARRNRRKLAAQFLDAELSREIDETLTRTDFQPPPRINVPPQAPSPLPPSPSEPSMALIRSPSPPPQLPPLDLGRLSIRDFPPLLASAGYTPPESPPPVCKGVPSWCPPIPSRTQNGAWSGKLPMFWDLSRLREPSEPAVTEKKDKPCQELQLWKGNAGFQPRKQSRFFPPSPKPTVKLPPTACRLHHTESPVQDPITTAWSTSSTPPPPYQFGSCTYAKDFESPARDGKASPSAANLWHILNDIELDRINFQPNRQESDWESEDGGARLEDVYDQHPRMAELDGRELPYVHQNSLTGYENESAAYHSGNHCFDDCGGILSDSAIYLADLFSAMDYSPPEYELAAMPWPINPASPRIMEPQASLSYYPPVEAVAKAPTNTDSDDIARSSDQFESEQKLFDTAIATSLPQSPIESECDLAMFLSMGHVENCWCRDCDEPPVMVDDETVFTPTTEDDDYWVWSTDDDEPGSTPYDCPYGWKIGNEDEAEVTRRQCGTAPEWDAYFPPAVEMALAPEMDWYGSPDGDEAEEHDWLWSL